MLIINTDGLFKETSTMRTYVDQLVERKEKDVPCEDHWLEIFFHFNHVHTPSERFKV
jgi:hypothetical protein